ncbi:MAG: ATP-binding protein [Anaerovoracaceae bacterium]
MNRATLKIISIITIFSVGIAFAIGFVALRRSTDYLTAEIEGKIVSTAENYSHDFSGKFSHMEGLTDSLAAHVSTTFDKKLYEENPIEYMNQYKANLGKMIKTTISTTDIAHSLYVTFNPKLTPNNDEVWYIISNEKIKKVYADFKKNKRDFVQPYDKSMTYFFQPQKEKTGIWTQPYFDKDIDKKVCSYSRAIYVEGIFVGVAGADITTEDTVDAVSNMKLYKGGYSALLDNNFQFIICPQTTDEVEKNKISTYVQKKLKGEKSKKSGIIKYTSDNVENIMGFSRMENGWTLIINQPKSQAFSPIESLTWVMILLWIILAIVLFAFLIILTRPFLRRQHSLEEENREKDIMLIYQSRQAKIGEMMGNITHQWKQPLNTINLILANLLDSYRFGDLDEDRLEKGVNKVECIVLNMSETISDFYNFLKPSKEKSEFDVKDCIKSALSLMEESISYHGIYVEQHCQGNSISFGYPNELTHVIFNILDNARDEIVRAKPSSRSIDICLLPQEEILEIIIENQGKQIAAADMEHLFEPYFTTKEEFNGTGLGLYISKEIIEHRMGGKLVLENTPEGVRCRISLPTP